MSPHLSPQSLLTATGSNERTPGYAPDSPEATLLNEMVHDIASSSYMTLLIAFNQTIFCESSGGPQNSVSDPWLLQLRELCADQSLA